jgi:hypothetical protein
MVDVKALAARTRAQTGSHPVLPKNPAEISGVRPRRDSVVGTRLTPPPRVAASGALPNWFWGVLGCLSVLLVGFGALFFLGQSGKLAPYLESVAPVAAPAAPPVVAEAPPPAPAEPPPAAAEPDKPAAAEVKAEPKAAEPAPAAPPAPTEKAPAAAAPEAPAEKAPAREHAAAKAHAPKAPTDKPTGETAEPAAAPAEDNAAEEAPAEKAPAKVARAPKAAPAAAAPADEGDDDQSAPGQDAVEAALDGLASKVRGCFVKYQIKGIARVRLVATPAGTAESVNVTGDFEDTPTGMCVESVIAGAKLPTFKGPPLKLSQSYQLR